MFAGSPIGTTIAFLRIQHKAQLGDKLIKFTTIFRDGRTDEEDEEIHVQLLYRIEDPDWEPEDGHVLGRMSMPSVQHGEARYGGKNAMRMHRFSRTSGRSEKLV